ncbi:hypothetical protein JOB18_042653 [Solea senegalensis]|uniref:Uncharacterized protein n=1 Tax=Solea senegalensis TaxID=28829 RepID=A0AAV6SX60_SOLSE|nr:hypothetical protein JOB18_042653 [Solea senegalensis]
MSGRSGSGGGSGRFRFLHTDELYNNRCLNQSNILLHQRSLQAKLTKSVLTYHQYRTNTSSYRRIGLIVVDTSWL